MKPFGSTVTCTYKHIWFQGKLVNEYLCLCATRPVVFSSVSIGEIETLKLHCLVFLSLRGSFDKCRLETSVTEGGRFYRCQPTVFFILDFYFIYFFKGQIGKWKRKFMCRITL